jgi:hypothetical protein
MPPYTCESCGTGLYSAARPTSLIRPSCPTCGAPFHQRREVERWDDEGGSLGSIAFTQLNERQAVAERNLRQAVAERRRLRQPEPLPDYDGLEPNGIVVTALHPVRPRSGSDA